MQFAPKHRTSLEEALQTGGVWTDWLPGEAAPAAPLFWGARIASPALDPHIEGAPFPAMGLACIFDATVLDQAFIASSLGEPYQSDTQLPRYINYWLERGMRPTQRRSLTDLTAVHVPGLSALVHHCHADIYGHWLLESMPKLLYLSMLPNPPKQFILQAGTRPHIQNWIKHVFPEAEFVSYDPETEYLRCEKLLSPTMACSAAYVFNPRLNPLLDRIAPSRRVDRLLYLDRAWPSSFHWMLNPDDVRKVAQSFGFEVYFPANHAVVDQLETFASARVLAADFGSALHNALFCSPGTRVLAFNWVNTNQSRIAQLRGQKVGFQLGTTGERVINEGYRVDLDDAKRAFEAALSA